ncbi:hypothetical protein ABKN59_009245 [Abortiporus biennis]
MILLKALGLCFTAVSTFSFPLHPTHLSIIFLNPSRLRTVLGFNQRLLDFVATGLPRSVGLISINQPDRKRRTAIIVRRVLARISEIGVIISLAIKTDADGPTVLFDRSLYLHSYTRTSFTLDADSPIFSLTTAQFVSDVLHRKDDFQDSPLIFINYRLAERSKINPKGAPHYTTLRRENFPRTSLVPIRGFKLDDIAHMTKVRLFS